MVAGQILQLANEVIFGYFFKTLQAIKTFTIAGTAELTSAAGILIICSYRLTVNC